MSSDIHAERRDPEQPHGAFDLGAAADDLLQQARELAAGRAARTLTPGDTPLRQTLLAIAAGRKLEEHRAPGPATLQVLVGDVSVHTGDAELQLGQAHWAAVPTDPHDLRAETDAVVLLTVVLPGRDAD